MLLRSMLLDGPDMAVEQVLFTSIEYPEKVDLARFDVDTKEEYISWIEPKTAQAVNSLSAQQNYKTNAVDRVGFLRLPDGYEEVSETYRPMPIDDGPISHVMVSDGYGLCIRLRGTCQSPGTGQERFGPVQDGRHERLRTKS